MPERLKHHTVRALRWSEQYTHLDMVYFASGSFWQTFGQAGSSILALGLVFVFANFLPKETYGTYRYLISLAGLLNIFTITGMSQAVTQAVANGHEGILRTAVRYQLKWNLILMFASWALGAYYLLHANFAYGGALLVLSLSTPLSAAFNTYGPYLAGKRQFRLNNIFSVLSTVMYVAGMLAAIFISGQVIWLVVAYALTTAVANLIFYFLTLRMFKPPIASTLEAGPVLKYGRELTFINFIGPIVAQLDSVILNHFWGPAQLAVYSLAMAIPNRAVPLMKNWLDIGFPKLATRTAKEINTFFYKRILQGFGIGVLCAAGYIVLAPYVFKYLMPQYLESVFYSQLLAVSFIFALPTRYIGLLFASQKLSRLMFISNSIQNVIRIILYIVFGIWGGILGLIVAQLFCSLLGVVVNMIAWLVYSRSKI